MRFSLYYPAPGVPPPNVTLYDRYEVDAIRITWDAIPLEDENGYMKGYKIRYQLVRRGGVDVTVGNPPIIVTFDRFVFAHEIKGLLNYAQYKVEVYGYANEGDGPKHTMIAGKSFFY